MRVLLRDDVENLGRKGEVVTVSDGYARNYLMPHGLAIRATKGVEKQAEAMQRSRAIRETREREAAEELAGRLSSGPIRVTARAGAEGKLFGSVTNSDIAAAILGQLDLEVDRRVIELGEPIKELGDAEVTVRLHPEVHSTVTVSVVAE